MATNQVKHVSFFDVSEDRNHSAYYSQRVDLKISQGNHGQIIRDAVRADGLPNGGARPPRGIRSSERALDVIETRSGGVCVYVFRLSATRAGSRLTFVENQPFIKLPLNSDGNEDFLTSLQTHDASDQRWASFACDLDLVRQSVLAGTIKAGAHGHHLPVLTIPFCFNVYDEGLKASPWVVPGHSHSEMLYPAYTHGGVHPPTASFLTVLL